MEEFGSSLTLTIRNADDVWHDFLESLKIWHAHELIFEQFTNDHLETEHGPVYWAVDGSGGVDMPR